MSESGKAHRQHEHRTVEQILDEERGAELGQSGDRDREYCDGQQRAPDIGSAWSYSRGAEESASERGQHQFLPDSALADLELRLKYDAGDCCERS